MTPTHTRNVEELVARQARLWEIRTHLSDLGGEPARQALVHLDQGPWIAISRQIGSGGEEVARRLSERLGWQVFDREILQAIAERSGTTEEILSRLDEQATGKIERALRQYLDPGPAQSNFVWEMMRVMGALAHKGKVILLGRGANFFLDSRYGLRPRIIAPFPLRIERVARARGIPPSEAEREVRAIDLSQERFIRQVFDRDIHDPAHYDLIVNTGELDSDTVAEALLCSLRKKLLLAD